MYVLVFLAINVILIAFSFYQFGVITGLIGIIIFLVFLLYITLKKSIAILSSIEKNK